MPGKYECLINKSGSFYVYYFTVDRFIIFNMQVDYAHILRTPYECHALLNELNECRANHKFLKFLRVCDHIDGKVKRCFKKDLSAKQNFYNEYSIKRHELRAELMKHMAEECGGRM